MKPLAQNSLIQNRYLIVQLIGKGGMGEVYLAVDQRLGSAVALKRTFFAGDEMLGNAFEREARTLARMRHPVLPKVSDHFSEGDEQYLVMEHISGDDLSKRLELSQKPFPISWVLFWADQLLDALSYLHSHEPPIIHRDIKPQNLKLTDENNIILLDFGLSKTSTGMTNISQSGSTGSVVGYTPHYAPMEQIRGIGTSARSDLYSLSATLYQLLTNSVPPDALSRADIMLNGSPDPVVPVHELNPEVSPTVSDVILKGMEVSQEKRFADAREMQKVLRRAFTEMQEAMSAKTIALTGDQIAAPAGVVGTPTAVDQGALSSPRTKVDQSVPEMPFGSPADADFDATIPIDLETTSQPNRNSDAGAGRYEQGSSTSQPSDANRQVVSNQVVAETAGSADGASFGRSDAENIEEERETSQVTGAGSAHSAIAGVGAVQQPAATKKTSSGKKGALAGGIAALLVLCAIGAVGGWYFYKNYQPTAVAVEPTPMPAASVAPAPTAQPTQEVVADTNLLSNAAPVDAAATTDENTNTASNRNASTASSQAADTAPRPAAVRTPAAAAAARPAAQPAPKSTPRPRTPSDRTVILQ